MREETMCHIFSGQDPSSYAYHTRSVRLGGHSTSIRLEAAFWQILEEIAAGQGVSLARFLTTLHDEVLENVQEAGNFTSLLRCACLTYVSEVRGRPEAEMRLRMSAEQDYGAYLATRQAALL
jgi:predicted DNA-binding ribbon-helix-helix protein